MTTTCRMLSTAQDAGSAALRALVSANDVLSGICQDNIDHLRQHGFPARKIVLIGNGIDTTPYASAKAPARVRRLLFLGRIVEQKGVFELLEAFTRVHAERPDVTLTIAGEEGRVASSSGAPPRWARRCGLPGEFPTSASISCSRPPTAWCSRRGARRCRYRCSRRRCTGGS